VIIKCAFSIPLEGIREQARKVIGLSPMPGYITKRGPYIKENGGTGDQVIVIYEFDKSKLSEAWEIISKQLDTLRGVPGFTLSAHLLAKGKRDNAA
jgi:hypothetical protein